jgi:copper(I)-binding protein
MPVSSTPLSLAFLALLALPATAATPDVKATNAWCRAAPAGAPAGGCYVTLTASSDDRLVAVETPAADHAEIHTMSMEGDLMRMRRLPNGLVLPAARPVALKPGAEHLMIIGPKTQMRAGGDIPITLKFAKAKPVSLRFPIRNAPIAGLSAAARGEH